LILLDGIRLQNIEERGEGNVTGIVMVTFIVRIQNRGKYELKNMNKQLYVYEKNMSE